MVMFYWTFAFIAMAISSTINNVDCYLAKTGFSMYPYRSNLQRSKLMLETLPRDITFDAGQVEIIRMIGKIDVQIDQQILDEARKEMEKSGGNEKKVTEFNQWNTAASSTGSATSVRVFEARIPGGTKCFLKEFLPVGLAFGR
jgi:hypothetical protein